MDNRLYLIDLYDYYGELLTEKQKSYFEDYYFNNLTLSEIGDNYNVTRNAIHKQIKEATELLNYYEEKLKLYNKATKINEIIKDLDEKTKNKIEELI